MNMSQTLGPACSKCGGGTRIFGSEPHPRLSKTDLRTYVCDACDRTEVVAVPVSVPKTELNAPAT